MDFWARRVTVGWRHPSPDKPERRHFLSERHIGFDSLMLTQRRKDSFGAGVNDVPVAHQSRDRLFPQKKRIHLIRLSAPCGKSKTYTQQGVFLFGKKCAFGQGASIHFFLKNGAFRACRQVHGAGQAPAFRTQNTSVFWRKKRCVKRIYKK